MKLGATPLMTLASAASLPSAERPPNQNGAVSETESMNHYKKRAWLIS